jgi:transposase
MVMAIWYVLRNGCPWRDVPSHFGPWSSIFTRWRRWCATGLWEKVLAQLAREATGELRHLDCSHIKLHQHGANPAGGQAFQAIGRTKGRINAKLAAVVDAHGRAINLCLAPGQQHDLKAVLPLVGVLRNKHAVADRGFDADTFHSTLQDARVRACIRPKRGRGWRHRFHRGYYRRRHRVENFFCRIKRYRRIATRYDKLAITFLASFSSPPSWIGSLTGF